MSVIQCPFCGVSPKQYWKINSWKYGRTADVTRYECTCGNDYNVYVSKLGKTWIIPKRKKSQKPKPKNNL